ncbi:MAG TPA: MMPL family transporter [Polyangiaceae bacterium]|nr:MMPL family transporter [Polyangiaceae bacterium]
MTRFIRFILKYRALVGALLVLSVVVSLYAARTIRARFQFRDFYDYPGNTELPLFRQDIDQFGDPAGYVVAMVESDDVFRPDVVAYVQKLTQALEPERTFARVRSLTNVHAIRGTADEVVSGPLYAQLVERPGGLAEFKRFALQSPLLRRRLVSADAKATAVLAEMRTPTAFSTFDEHHAALGLVERAISRIPAPPGTEVRVTGAPAVEAGVTASLVSDQLVLMPGVLVVLCIVLYLTFRSWHGIVLCLAAVGVATVWTAACFAQLHRPVDIIGSVIPTTILVYGVVDPIFVLARVMLKLESGLKREEAIVRSFSELALPCFLTSLTTSIGFAAFVTARQLTIRYYGLTVAIGVLLAWVTSMTVLPVLLSVVPLPKRQLSTGAWERGLDRALGALWDGLRKRVPHAIVASVVLLVAGSWFASKQHLDNVYVDELPHGKARRDVRHLEQKLSGVLGLTVHLQGARDSMKRPAVLQAVQAVDTTMEREPAVTLSTSLSDLVAEANQAFLGGDQQERRVPSSQALIAQYLALIEPSDRATFVSSDYSQSHLAIVITDQGSERTRALVAKLRKAVESAGFVDLGVKAEITGTGVVGYTELDRVVEELLWGFITAFGLIVLLQWALFRSLRIALIGIIPNLLPVVACFLTLRALGIHLRIDTALVLCISVGGLFNTTIHLAARVRQLAIEGQRDADGIVGLAMRTVGPPSLFTAAALSAGFAVLLLSSFPGLQALGLLSMVTLVIGFFADMIVTPVLLRAGFDWKSFLRAAPPSGGAVLPAIAPTVE